MTTALMYVVPDLGLNIVVGLAGLLNLTPLTENKKQQPPGTA